ncbi:glycosyltransferase [Roseovarius sp. SYSU LYC5161]|uniref:glycosyltransferase n=1 Tax=Roseovarius halophilus (ex Wu et al. 2025) TaxID=3376060 RepID=UPI00399A82CB
MGISELRELDAQRLEDEAPVNLMARALVRDGRISRDDAARAQIVLRHCDASVGRILVAEHLVTEEDLLRTQADRLSVPVLGAAQVNAARSWPCDEWLPMLLRHAILPVDLGQGYPTLVTNDAEAPRRVRQILPADLAVAPVALAPRETVQAAIAARFGATLAESARTRVPEGESCRTWGGRLHRRLGITVAVLGVLTMLTLFFPTAVFGVLVAWACVTLLVSACLKAAAFVAAISAGPDSDPPARGGDRPLPKVSILVPLFRETEIAHALIARLSRLTYPKCLLDVILVLEEADETTRETLAGIDLPPWIRAVVVPDGQPRTKPRAMNYALDFCDGDIIGIFDAEDAPDPDQITAVARRFQTAPPEVACLQGVLDYYNPRQNWLARCFTIEYASWFRLMLPGMARLGFAIPLGGTTLYFRRDSLEALGGWDAHNVTEDADLGFRLARHGYRTEMIGTVTEEEANCRPWAWIKQRSRWLKGYMTTYLVHMRRPFLLYRQLGGWKFLGFQAHFVSALSQFTLAPLLWSFWLVMLGLPHPLDPVVPQAGMIALGAAFLLIEVINIVIYMTGVSGVQHRHLLAWAPTMHFYAPLAALASYKALYELVFTPFFWDKTAHGLSQRAGGKRRSDGAVDLSGIKLQPGHEGF